MTIWRTHRTNGHAKKSKQKSNWLAVTSALILHHALQVQFISQQWKRIKKKSDKELNQYTLFLFVLTCSVCYYPVQSNEWRGLVRMQRIARGRGATENCQSVTAATIVCWAPCVDRVKGGDTAKNLGIEYIILYIISMTQNVNRFIYSPMFKYICRLYTNSLENETANVFFFLPSLFFLTWYSEQWWWRGWWDRDPVTQSRGYREIRKCILWSEWLVLQWPNKTPWFPSCCIRCSRGKEER